MITFVPQDSRLPSHLRMGRVDADVLYLLLHGFPDNARVWEPLMRALPETAFKLAPFAPGTDGMTPTKKELTIDSQRDRILNLVESVKCSTSKEIVLIGHDLGGGLVEPLQEALRSTIRGSVYINCMRIQQFYKRWSSVRQLLKSTYMLVFQLPFLRQLIHPVAKPFLNAVYSHGGLSQEDELRSEGIDVLWGLEIYRQYGVEMLRQIGRPVEKTSTPTLFLFGSRDPYIIPSAEDELCRFHERFRMVSLNAGHWPQRDLAEEIALAIAEFVEETPNMATGD